jgi:uncharacterized protein (DUF58 family)
MGLLRYQLFTAYAVAFLSIWYIALQKKDELDLPAEAMLLIDFAPIWAVVAIGVYLLLVLIIGVLTFKDCPAAALELELEVTVARVELGGKGIL